MAGSWAVTWPLGQASLPCAGWSPDEPQRPWAWALRLGVAPRPLLRPWLGPGLDGARLCFEQLCFAAGQLTLLGLLGLEWAQKSIWAALHDALPRRCPRVGE